MNRQDLRAALVVARTDIRVSIRNVLDQPRLLIAWLISGLFLIGFTGFLFVSAVGTGRVLLADGASISESALGRIGLAAVAIVGLGGYLAIAAVFEDDATGPVETLLRTSLPIESIVLGRLLSVLVRNGAILVLPLLVGVFGLGVGARSPAVAVLGTVGATVALGVGYVVGYVASASGRYVLRQLPVSRWLRIGVQGLATLAVFAVIFQWTTSTTATDNPIVGVLARAGTAYVSVVLAPLGAPLQQFGVVAFGASLLVVAVGSVAVVRLESTLLVLGDEESGNRSTGTSRAVPGVFARLPATRTAWHLLVRTVRDPRLVTHLGIALMYLAIFLLSSIPGFGANPALIAGIAVTAGVTVAGGAYCLNPLGDDRPQRPLVLTSTSRLTRLLHGRAIAGLVPGGLLAVGIAVPLVAVGDTVLHPIGLAGLSVVLLLSGAGTALGLGSLVPSYERSEYMNVERIHPSIIVLVLYMIGSGLTTVFGIALLWITTDNGIEGPLLAAWGVFLVIVAVVGGGGYAYARRRIAGQTLEE